MRNLALLLIIFVMSSNWSFADVFVVTDKDGSVYSISEQDDAVVPSGYKKDIIQGSDIDKLGLTSSPTDYKYAGKKFSIDVKKVKAKDDAQVQAERVRQDKEAAKMSAINKLKALGLNEAEISVLTN